MIFSGLDLGQAKDYTALACIRRIPLKDPVAKRRWRYECGQLLSWPLGVSYPTMAQDVGNVYKHDTMKGSYLVVDYTGVGRPVYDQLKVNQVQARMVPILTTGGKLVSQNKENGAWHVPKTELVSTLQVVIQSDLIKIHSGLKLADRLKKELADFKVKITKAANETFGADSSQHDDLVFALMLAVYYAEMNSGGLVEGIGTPLAGQGTLAESAPPGVYLEAQNGTY